MLGHAPVSFESWIMTAEKDYPFLKEVRNINRSDSKRGGEQPGPASSAQLDSSAKGFGAVEETVGAELAFHNQAVTNHDFPQLKMTVTPILESPAEVSRTESGSSPAVV